MARLGLGQLAVVRGATVAGAARQAARRAARRRPGRQPQPPQRRPGARPAPLAAARAGPHLLDPRPARRRAPVGDRWGCRRLGWRRARPACRHARRPDRPPRLLLLDGHSLAYRAFFALPVENFSTTTGQHTNAVYGFTSMLINVLRDEQPTHVGVAFDVSRQTFRTEEYADYKANRSKTPDEFSGQVSLIKEVLAALRIATIEKDGYEADDVIGTLATQAVDAGLRGADLHRRPRLVPAGRPTRSTVLYPSRGVSEMARMTPAAVEEKYGVPPEPLPRARRAGRRDLRQPARRARRRPQDRRQVDQPVRRPRRRHRQRRRDQGQGRRLASASTSAT